MARPRLGPCVYHYGHVRIGVKAKDDHQRIDGRAVHEHRRGYQGTPSAISEISSGDWMSVRIVRLPGRTP